MHVAMTGTRAGGEVGGWNQCGDLIEVDYQSTRMDVQGRNEVAVLYMSGAGVLVALVLLCAGSVDAVQPLPEAQWEDVDAWVAAAPGVRFATFAAMQAAEGVAGLKALTWAHFAPVSLPPDARVCH
jgi:hypothetical protein